MKTEARHILDTGASPAQMAAELGIHRATAEAIAQNYHAPKWPTWTPEQLQGLPERLRRMIEANNPNHRSPAQ